MTRALLAGLKGSMSIQRGLEGRSISRSEGAMGLGGGMEEPRGIYRPETSRSKLELKGSKGFIGQSQCNVSLSDYSDKNGDQT